MYTHAPSIYMMPSEVGRGIRTPGTGVKGGCELPSGCLEPNPDPHVI